MHEEKMLSMEEIAAMGEAIAETAAIIDVATHRFLTQLREFDRADGWHRAGALSCAHWLSWRVGIEISCSKVRAMTRVANPANEIDLLRMARAATGAQLEKICRLKRLVNRLAGESAKEVEGRRYVVERDTEDGMVSIQLRLLPEEAARFIKAIEVMGGGNRADGAVALSESALSGKPAGEEGSVPAALRRALDARDGGCRFPACTNRIFTDGHHIEHWLNGGETNLADTVLLCRRHHRYLHEYGFSLERVGDDLIFRDPEGRVLEAQGKRPAIAVDLAASAAAWSGGPVTASANTPGWDGERVDYHSCVGGLA